jgi:hypothetical protein
VVKCLASVHEALVQSTVPKKKKKKIQVLSSQGTQMGL